MIDADCEVARGPTPACAVVAIFSITLLSTSCLQSGKADPARSRSVATSESVKLKPPSLDADKPADFPGLHNVVAFGPGLLSGSAPDEDEGFETLQAMGVKTIISVDGATPASDKAADHGIQYVHLPIGYDGADSQRALELSKAVKIALEKDPSSPVYIHCHHGKHRSASASAVVAVTLGFLTRNEALARMKTSGTAADYRGLFRCVSAARLARQEELAAISNDFPTVWKTSGLIKTMVAIDNRYEHLKAIERAGWITPDDHPDLVPSAEAGSLADHLRNLYGDDCVKAKPDGYRALLVKTSKQAESIEGALIEGRDSPAELSKQFREITASCKECHARYRD